MMLADRALRAVAQRLSLRKPQADSLEILAEILERVTLSKGIDPATALAAVRDLCGELNLSHVEDFERDFPSLCFALATGVGKTRLMGAFITYLYLTGRSNNFFVLAPNTTIYQKLVADLTPGTPKYVFKGIAEFAVSQPVIVTGETWDQSALLIEGAQ